MQLRIICFLSLIVSAAIFPLPVALAIFSLGVFCFQKFFEGIAAGLFLDALYFSPEFFSNINTGFFTITLIVFIIFTECVKRLVQKDGVVSKLVMSLACFIVFYSLVLVFGKFL